MTTTHPLTLFRQQRGLTRAQLGAEINVSEVTIWRWENGKRMPRGEDLRRLCEFTKIPAAAFLGMPEPQAGAA